MFAIHQYIAKSIRQTIKIKPLEIYGFIDNQTMYNNTIKIAYEAILGIVTCSLESVVDFVVEPLSYFFWQARRKLI